MVKITVLSGLSAISIEEEFAFTFFGSLGGWRGEGRDGDGREGREEGRGEGWGRASTQDALGIFFMAVWLVTVIVIGPVLGITISWDSCI